MHEIRHGPLLLHETSHSYFVVMSHRYITAPLHGYRYEIYCYHRYMDSRHITVTHACHVFISLLHVQSMFNVTIFMLYDCFLLLIWISRYWTWELLICDMWNPTSIVPVSRYIVLISHYIVLCYQQSSGPVILLPVSCTVFVLVTLYTWHIRS